MKYESNVYRLDRTSSAKISALDKSKTLVMAVQSPIEVHGPHLPMGQDLLEAEAIAERAINLLAKERPDWSFIMLPPAAVSIDCVPGVGSVPYPIHVVRDVAYYSLRPFAKAGFARLAYSSFHGSPRHIVALEDAAAALNKKYGVPAASVFSAAVARIIKGSVFHEAVKDIPDFPLSNRQLDLDSHAGCVETSLGLLLWPELVDPGWENLPPCTKCSEDDDESISFLFDDGEKDLLKSAEAGIKRIQSMGDSLAHFKKNSYAGYPAVSSVELGQKLLDMLVELSRSILSDFIDRGSDMDVSSPLWKFRHVLQNKTVNFLVDDVFKLYG